MISGTLYKRGMKSNIKLLVVLGAVITLYVSVIISMYNPEFTNLLDGYVELMPELMAAVGMTARATSLIDFMCSYLYGFILVIFPMLFCIFCGNGLVAKYVDNNSMVSLVAAPIKRRNIAFTQMAVLVSGILLLMIYNTILEIVCAEYYFPGELDIAMLVSVNIGLLCLHLFMGGICFFISCIFSDIKHSIGFGVGILIFMYAIKMLANIGGKAEKIKYFTFFTLFDPQGIITGENNAIIGIIVLFISGIALFFGGIITFSKKDLHI